MTELYAAKGTLPQEVEAVAFELGDGETSDMISTDDGYYFIKCISKLTGKKQSRTRLLYCKSGSRSSLMTTMSTL